MNKANCKTNLLIASVLLLIAGAAQAAEVVGKVGYMSGSLVAKRADGSVKIMASKSEVLEGDVLGTAKDSYAQILMSDGMKMTLRPNSNLKIVDYRFKKENPQEDTAVFNLLKGGLRSVTGLVGKRGNPDAYKMQTKVATVGIRGTDYSARLCETENCQDDAAAPKLSAAAPAKPQTSPLQTAWQAGSSLSMWKLLALPLKGMMTSASADNLPAASPAGLYVTVHTGAIMVAQPSGNLLNLGRGETGFANAAALIRLPAPPAFMAADTKQTDAVAAKAAKAEEKAAAKPDDGKAPGKTDKEKDGAKSEKDKDSGKADKEKDGAKSDKEKDGAKPDKEKDSAKPEAEKTDSKPDEGKGGQSAGKSEEGAAANTADGGNAAGNSDGGNAAGKDTINPDAGNASNPDPSVNKSGCVVQ